MSFKFGLLFAAACFVASASAGLVVPAAPLAAAAVAAPLEEYDPHPQYTYGYDVKDALSGDSKNQVETRDGDIVQGQYSLNDADGYRRIVDYSADPINGFNAVVRREPLVAAAALPHTVFSPAPAPLVKASAPLVAAAPAIVKTHFASPLISYGY